MKRRTIGIVGVGHVGSILAAYLAKNGEDVVLEDINKNLLDEIAKNGLRIFGPGVAMTIPRSKEFAVMGGRFNIAYSISELSEFGVTVVFIATKASVLKHVLPEIRETYSADMKIVSFQNGLGNEELIAERLGIGVIYRVVINYAGNIVTYGNVRMNWFNPPNYVGAFIKKGYGMDDTTRYIASIMTDSGLKTEESSDIREQVWEKTILNSPLCPICGLTGRTMKGAMEFEPTYNLAVEVLKEGVEVARKDGYDFNLKELISYLKKGGDHKPSMLMDIENKRSTEIDFLNGRITALGKMHKVPTPYNSALTALIKALESQN